MSVTLAQASTIVDTALKKGRDTNCAPLTVAVLDAGGHLVAFKREDKSGLLRFDIAFGKAWGALGMGFGSRTLAGRAAKTPQFFTMLAEGKARGVELPLVEKTLACYEETKRNVSGAAEVSAVSVYWANRAKQ